MVAISIVLRALREGRPLDVRELTPACVDPKAGLRVREILAPHVGGDVVELSTRPLRWIVAAYNARLSREVR